MRSTAPRRGRDGHPRPRRSPPPKERKSRKRASGSSTPPVPRWPTSRRSSGNMRAGRLYGPDRRGLGTPGGERPAGICGRGGDRHRRPRGCGRLPALPKVCVVAQTTQSLEDYAAIVRRVKERFPEAVIFDTICDSTEKRGRPRSRRLPPERTPSSSSAAGTAPTPGALRNSRNFRGNPPSTSRPPMNSPAIDIEPYRAHRRLRRGLDPQLDHRPGGGPSDRPPGKEGGTPPASLQDLGLCRPHGYLLRRGRGLPLVCRHAPPGAAGEPPPHPDRLPLRLRHARPQPFHQPEGQQHQFLSRGVLSPP